MVEDVPVVKQRQVPMVETVTKTVEVPQVQIFDVIEDCYGCHPVGLLQKRFRASGPT